MSTAANTITAARIHEHGGPEVFRLEQVVLPDPGPGEVLVRNTAIALNFYDVYERTGLYPIDLPATLGCESAGVIEAVGPEVADLRVGDRVAVLAGPGNYAQAMIAPASALVPLPAEVDEKTAAAAMTKAMTVEYLLERCFRVRRGQTILFHAAAGGVGLLACQWARALGVRTIGTVSTGEKAERAAAAGCDVPVVFGQEDVAEVVRRETRGKGVPVVYDSIGKDSFQLSLACLARRGTLVSFGQSSGEPEPFQPRLLARHGSIYITRPGMGDYTATRQELLSSAERVFAMLAGGKLVVSIGQTFALEDIAEAHRALEGRATVGSTVILP
jgi:NADPH:quinone reductase